MTDEPITRLDQERAKRLLLKAIGDVPDSYRIEILNAVLQKLGSAIVVEWPEEKP